MYKAIILFFVLILSSHSLANITSPFHPLNINSPLNVLNPNSIYHSDAEEKPADVYDRREIVIKKAIPQTASYSYVIFLDKKTNKLLRQRACYTVNTKINKTYIVSYNVSKNHYALSCAYLK